MAATARSTAVPARLGVLQALDRRFGPWLCRHASARVPGAGRPGAPLPAGEVRRVLVVRPGGLGDAVLLRPALAALGAGFPGAQIDVLAERRNAAGLAAGEPRWPVALYDQHPVRALRALRAARYDLVVDTEQYHCLPALLANTLRPRWACGFATLGRGRLLTHAVPHDEDRYEAESFLDLVRALTGDAHPFDPERPYLAADAQALAWADGALGAGGRPVAALLPAAGSPYRLWAPDRFAAVARALAERGWQPVLIGGADAVDAAAVISAGAPGVIDLAGRTTLARTIAVLARAGLAVGSDSGVLHLAAALGTPTVALFGPGLHRKWAPPGRRHRVVRLGLPCSPCIRAGRLPPCPHDLACMRGLGAPAVVAAVDELLAAGLASARTGAA